MNTIKTTNTMSYAYRYKKRKFAHLILKYLVENDVSRNPSWEPLEDREVISIKKFAEMFNSEYGILYAAVYLLERNKHVEDVEPNGFLDDNSDIRLLPPGQEAFYESYYRQENRKDLSQSIELYTRWVIPILSLGLSILALAISIHKK
jgi:hypothetical protein